MKLANLETFIDIDHVYVDFSFRITRIRTIIAAENNCDWSRQIFVWRSGAEDRHGFMALMGEPCIQGY